MKESNIMRSCMMKICEDKNKKIFRNNVGVGVAYNFKEKKVRTPLQVIEYGLCKGSADLIGWKSIEVTPEMVGQRLAIFTAIEIKRPEQSYTSEEQSNFLKSVQDSGGIALIAKSPKDLNF